MVNGYLRHFFQLHAVTTSQSMTNYPTAYSLSIFIIYAYLEYYNTVKGVQLKATAPRLL